jgi:hypothetical protein
LREFFFLCHRIAGTPFSLNSFDGHMRSITPKHLVEQPGFDHVVMHRVTRPGDIEELRFFQ